MFPSNGFSSNFGSFTLTVSIRFKGERMWFEVVSLTEECSELFVSKLQFFVKTLSIFVNEKRPL